MTTIEFKYEPWDRRNDQRTIRQSTDRAFGIVHNDIEFLTEPNDGPRNKNLDPIIDEVAALVAECLDWLRSHDVPASKIQSRVNSMRRKSLEQPHRETELTIKRLNIYDAPDPHRKGESLPKTKKPIEVK